MLSKNKMASCDKCYCLTISSKRIVHIIENHFYFEDWRLYSIKPWQSFFFPNVDPKDLFHLVQKIPRCELGQIGWSYHRRFVYTLEFKSDLGFYPYQGGTTSKIQIVCDRVKCQACGICRPTAIRTIYPWDEYYEQYGRRKRPYAPRGTKRIGEGDGEGYGRRKRRVPAKRKPNL